MLQSVEIRCPVGPRRLLAKVLTDGQKPGRAEGNLLELNCPDCKKTLRSHGRQVVRVLHRYDVLGVLVETMIET